MKQATCAAAVIAALSLIAGGLAHAKLLVPQRSQQSAPQAAPQAPASRSGNPSAAPRSGRERSGHRPFVHQRPVRPFIHHHRPFFAAPIIVPALVAPPVYYYPPAPYVASPPVVYVERASGYYDEGYWYYCAPLSAYYPDVQQCPEPWQAVAPR